jgi:predicted RNA-binding protein with PIN domain
MNKDAGEREEKQRRFENLIGKALREGGYAMPLNEQEIDAMFDSLQTKQTSDEFIKKVCEKLHDKEHYTMRITPEAAKRLGDSKDTLREKEDPTGEFRAAARNVGEMSEETKKKLDEDRAKLDKTFREKADDSIG